MRLSFKLCWSILDEALLTWQLIWTCLSCLSKLELFSHSMKILCIACKYCNQMMSKKTEGHLYLHSNLCIKFKLKCRIIELEWCDCLVKYRPVSIWTNESDLNVKMWSTSVQMEFCDWARSLMKHNRL